MCGEVLQAKRQASGGALAVGGGNGRALAVGGGNGGALAVGGGNGGALAVRGGHRGGGPPPLLTSYEWMEDGSLRGFLHGTSRYQTTRVLEKEKKRIVVETESGEMFLLGEEAAGVTEPGLRSPSPPPSPPPHSTRHSTRKLRTTQLESSLLDTFAGSMHCVGHAHRV